MVDPCLDALDIDVAREMVPASWFISGSNIGVSVDGALEISLLLTSFAAATCLKSMVT